MPTGAEPTTCLFNQMVLIEMPDTRVDDAQMLGSVTGERQAPRCPPSISIEHMDTGQYQKGSSHYVLMRRGPEGKLHPATLCPVTQISRAAPLSDLRMCHTPTRGLSLMGFGVTLFGDMSHFALCSRTLREKLGLAELQSHSIIHFHSGMCCCCFPFYGTADFWPC